MSTKISGLRRVGIVGLSTVVAASMMTGFAATAAAAAGAYALVGTAPVLGQGITNQTAAGVTLDFANDFTSANSQTFNVLRGATANDCTTVAGRAAAVDFTVAPTVAVTGPFLADGVTAGSATSTKPTVTTTLTGSSASCISAGILDRFTVTIATPAVSAGVVTDTFRLTLSGVKYDVGATAATGNINLVATTVAPALFVGPLTVVNATVSNKSFSVGPVIVAQSSSTGNALSPAKFVETAAGAVFTTAGATPVVLTLANATFDTTVTPTFTLPTAPAGWTATAVSYPDTTHLNFTINAPAAATAATVSVSGLKIDVGAGGSLVTLKESLTPTTVNAAKVVDYNDRTGGSDRYATAAALFNGQFSAATTAVLSSGFDFPDALSANYLAGRLGTGTLLTRPTTLSNDARLSLLTGHAATVYVTGESGAVSEAVVNQVEALHVNNVPSAPMITVVRLGGSTRYDTNKIINENNFVASGTVLLASGEDFADALALGPIAADKHFPLILTKGVTLGANELTQLADFAPTKVIIAGGVGPVSAAIAADLTARGYTVTRLWGVGRSETAQAVATWGTTLAPAPLFLSSKTYIARGDDFADALAAGPVAGALRSMVVLTKTSTVLGAGIPAYLATKTVAPLGGTVTTSTHADSLHALGLSGAVTNAMMRAAAVTVGP